MVCLEDEESVVVLLERIESLINQLVGHPGRATHKHTWTRMSLLTTDRQQTTTALTVISGSTKAPQALIKGGNQAFVTVMHN